MLHRLRRSSVFFFFKLCYWIIRQQNNIILVNYSNKKISKDFLESKKQIILSNSNIITLDRHVIKSPRRINFKTHREKKVNLTHKETLTNWNQLTSRHLRTRTQIQRANLNDPKSGSKSANLEMRLHSYSFICSKPTAHALLTLWG